MGIFSGAVTIKVGMDLRKQQKRWHRHDCFGINLLQKMDTTAKQIKNGINHTMHTNMKYKIVCVCLFAHLFICIACAIKCGMMHSFLIQHNWCLLLSIKLSYNSKNHSFLDTSCYFYSITNTITDYDIMIIRII